MKKFVSWLVYSSENPNSFSLTLKGIAATVLPVAILLASQLGFTLDSSQVEAFVLSVVTILTTAITLFGIIRKIANTFKTTEVKDISKKLSPTKSKKKVASKK